MATVRAIKEAAPDKTYRALVKLGKPVKPADLKKLKKLVGSIHQRTPVRVAHRRAELLRKREVKSLRWKRLGAKKLELIVKGTAGLYIKELVSSDEGRTKPSVAELLGVPAKVMELDVIDIGKIKL
jgi:tRNA pseudouridine synthase 10